MTQQPSITTYPLTVAERRKALADANPVWRDETLDEAFRRLAAQYGSRNYVIADDGTWTYAETQQRADWLAKGLRSLGVGNGDRVALLIANYAIVAPLALAAWRLGASIIPLNFSYRAAELEYVIRQSRCKVFVTMEIFRNLNHLEMLDEIAPGWQNDLTSHFSELRAAVTIGETGRGLMTVDKLMAIGRSDSAPLQESPAAPSDTAVIMYTSGTTGAPKGVLLSHDQELRDTYSIALHRAYEDGRRIVVPIPLYHAFGLSFGLLATIWVGGSVVLRPIFDAEDVMKSIAVHRATDALLVPTMAMAIVDHPKLAQYDLSTLYACVSSAAMTPRWVWEKLVSGLGVTELVQGYGMTETTAVEVMIAPGDPIDKLEQTVGHIMNGGVAGIAELGGLVARVRITDPTTGCDVAPGDEGEILFHTPFATKGYFDMPVATQALFTSDGWLKTGDLGRLRSDGYLQLTGRAKEQYKSGGELVSPKEVEAVLCAHELVSQAYVFGLPNERWGEIGAAYVVPVEGTEPTEVDLIAWCKGRLAKFKWPRHILFCSAEELPKTATGKVQKFMLIKRAQLALGQP